MNPKELARMRHMLTYYIMERDLNLLFGNTIGAKFWNLLAIQTSIEIEMLSGIPG